jgi:hypothetical protein
MIINELSSENPDVEKCVLLKEELQAKVSELSAILTLAASEPEQPC